MLLAANSKPGKHLEFSHPAMSRVRTWVATKVADGEFHPRMIGNFDQVWSLLFRPSSSSLVKHAHVDAHAKQMSFRKVRHCLERALGLPYSECLDKDDGDHQVKEPTITGFKAANVAIEGWRIPRTLCTLSWCDGTVGRGFITCREGTISEKDRKIANDELSKWIHIGPLQPKTHIWNASTMQRYLAFLGEEIRARRRELGLEHSAKCLVICDQATQHSSGKWRSLRQAWCEQHNVAP